MEVFRRASLVIFVLATWLVCYGVAAGQDGTPAPVVPAAPAANDNTAFTYQGSLANATGPITDRCDFKFALFDQESGGTALGTALDRSNVTINQGRFAVDLDFWYTGFPGAPRWLEVAVRCPAGAGSYATLAPRQRVNSVPYALTAMTGRDGFTVYGDLWVNGTGIFGGPGRLSGLSVRSPDIYLNADKSFGRGDGGRALVHGPGDTLHMNFGGDFAGSVRIDSRATISGVLAVEGNDLFLRGERSRGDGGRALVHWQGDTLAINFGSDFAGGVHIDGPTTVSGTLSVNGSDLFLNGNDFEIHGEAARGDGGRALVQWLGDTLAVNFGNDFAGGILLDSDARVAKDLTVEGNTIRLLGNDLYIRGDADRGDGGRALVHATGDVLALNYDGDFAGGVTITNLRTGGIVEENLMTAPQRTGQTALPFAQGEVLCWDSDGSQLARCSAAVSRLVVAVADAHGRPLVFGVEPIRVAGPVAPGDLLVAAAAPGYATAWSQVGTGEPPAGTVVAKALEPSPEGHGLIQAFILLR